MQNERAVHDMLASWGGRSDAAASLWQDAYHASLSRPWRCSARLQQRQTGFEIFAFPCNLFGGPELGIDKEIIQIACTRFNAEYMIFLQGFCWRHWRSSKGS